MGATHHPTPAALRDFFLASSTSELGAAFTALAGGTEDPQAIDLEAAEFVFNKLFVGPMALQAPPYASCYLSSEPQLMGGCTLAVRRLYEMAGLASPLLGHLPEDHLGVELDAAQMMLALTAQVSMEAPRALWDFFLNQHLGAWVPQFLARARNADAAHPIIDLALDRLEAWLNDQRRQSEGYRQ
jgi:TorA maturation chaperone TorD